jgi:hypothetical protein
MEIFKNQYYALAFDAESSILTYTAFPETENMTEEEFENGMLNTSEVIEKLKPKFFLSDSREQYITIVPQMQEWVAQNIYPRWYGAGLKKLAIAIPHELVANLSMQQVVDEVEGIKEASAYEIRYFESDVSAKRWLLQ